MGHTTNTLLIIVIVLLVAVLFGNIKEKEVFANAAASSSPIIFSVTDDKSEVFLVNIERSIMLNYRVNKGFQLKGARRFDYDMQLSNPLDYPSGKSYAEIKYIVSKQK